MYLAILPAPMPHPITSPESFITSLISNISLLAPHPSPNPDSNVLSNPVSPPPPPAQNFSTLLSTLPKENQESITRHLMTLHFLFPHELITALDLLDRALVTRMIIGPRLSSPTNDASEVLDKKPHVDNQAPSNAPKGDLLSANDVHVAGAESRRPRQETDPNSLTAPKIGNESEPENEVFYVQSASSQTNAAARQRRRHHYTGTSSTSYEVRLAAWNCTCPAFALSAFNRITDLKSNGDDDDNQAPPSTNPIPGNDHHNDARLHHNAKSQTDLEWRFGGTLTRTTSEPEDEIDPDRIEASVPVPVPVPVCKHILAALLGKHVPGLFGSGVQLRTVTAAEGAGWAAGWGDGD